MIGWLAHNDDNKVVTLYNPEHDTEKTETRELTKLLRRGLTIREVTDSDAAGKLWGLVASEKALRACSRYIDYDDDVAAAHTAALMAQGWREVAV